MIRAALVDVWPLLAESFGIRPWEIEDLLPIELESALDVLNRRAQQAQKLKPTDHG